MTMTSGRGAGRPLEVNMLFATGAHVTGGLCGIYLALLVLTPSIKPSNGAGADGLAAGFLLLFALVQGLVHAIVAAFFRRSLVRRSPRQHLWWSLPAGTLSMLTVFGLLQIIHRESIERYSPLLVLGSFLLPGVIVSVATFWLASKNATDG